MTSGNTFDPGTPEHFRPELTETLRTLSRIRRFGGQGSHEDWTVAHHTLVGVLAAGDEALSRRFFLHDLHESVIGDIPKPLKPLFGEAFQQYERRLERVFHIRFGTPEDLAAQVLSGFSPVKDLDKACLIEEARMLGLDDGWTEALEEDYDRAAEQWPCLPLLNEVRCWVVKCSLLSPSGAYGELLRHADRLGITN